MQLKNMNELPEGKFPKRGEIWIVDYSFKFSELKLEEQEFTIESSIKKSRPCLIVSSDINNEFSDLVIAIPLSSDDLSRLKKFEVMIKVDEFNNLSKDSKALLILINNFNKNFRLKKLVGIVSEEVMTEITKKLASLLGGA